MSGEQLNFDLPRDGESVALPGQPARQERATTPVVRPSTASSRETPPRVAETPAPALGYGQAAPLYLAAGWEGVLPLPRGKKAPPPKGTIGKAGKDPDEDQVLAWAESMPDGNLALRLPTGVIGIDIDAYGEKVGAQTLTNTEQECGPLPRTWRTTSRRDDPVSGIRLYRVPGGRDWHDLGGDIEVIWRGNRHVVCWPSTHPEGRPYFWLDADGEEASGPPEPGELAELPDAWVAHLAKPPRERAVRNVQGESASVAAPSDRTARSARAAFEREVAAVRSARNGEREKVVCTQAAFNLGQWVGNGALDRAEVEVAIYDAAVECGWVDDVGPDHARHKIARAVEDGMAKPRPNVEDGQADPAPDLMDSPLAEWTAEHLGGRYCWAAGLGWLAYDGTVWRETTDANVIEAVRRAWRKRYAREINNGADHARASKLADLLKAAKVSTVVRLMRGILERRSEDFDAKPDLLNVGNGVIDLATGDLLPHSPDLLLTKITKVEYRPEAEHDDWRQALHALHDEVAAWLQTRFGQAATGHATPDDLLPVLQGNGANGKSTVVAAITAALGDHAVPVPERVLLANPSDHPTELTTLRGARLALIEETPEARHLSVKRLKDVVGTPTMTARRIRQDNMTWVASHSLFLTTNYRPRVNETDHGTWRRLALVSFPFTFRPEESVRSEWDKPGDPTLRERLRAGRQGQHEAVLAWVVDGALRWYANGRVLPPPPERVVADTTGWRAEADLVLGYVNDRVVFDADACVLATELFADFARWQEDRGGKAWADNTFAQRFGDHDSVSQAGVRKTRTRRFEGLSRRFRATSGQAPPNGPASVWSGVRFSHGEASQEELS